MVATKLNIFATSGSQGFLKCLIADKNYSIVGSDINSLEPHVLAHYSNDEGFLRIYSKGQPENCIYMYLAAHSEMHGGRVREVYDPINPDVSTLDEAKKVMDDDGNLIRPLYKVVVLSCNYQGGASVLFSKMKENNINMTEKQCEDLVRLHRSTFPGIPEFAKILYKECQNNGGYLLTGRGRPIAIPHDKRIAKDLLAYFCQSTGHDYLTRLLWHINQYRRDKNLTQVIKPYIVDFHDATYWQADNNYIDQAKEMIEYGYDRLNDELGLKVEIRGGIKIGRDFRIK